MSLVCVTGCPVKGESVPSIYWIHGNQSLSNEARSSYEILEGGQILRLNNINKDQLGEYSCVVKNPSDTISQKAVLSIQGSYHRS